MSSLFYVFFVIFNAILQTTFVFSQNLPSIACPNIFEYRRDRGTYYGALMLTNLPLTTTRVEVQLSQREYILNGFNGGLSLVEDLQRTQSNLENRRPVYYRVDFPNPNIPPKLTRISVNDAVLCEDQGLPPPSAKLKVHHTFYPSVPFNRNSLTPTQEFNNGNGYSEDITRFVVTRTFNPNSGNPIIQPTYQFRPIQPPIEYSNRPPNTFVSPRQRPPNFNNNSPPPPAPAPQPAQSNFGQQYSPSYQSNSDATCGVESQGLTPFIVGGGGFHRGKFPWLTAIYIRKGPDLSFTCSGSLISSRTVITAAHCFREPSLTANRIVVYLGRHNLYAAEEGTIHRDVRSLIMHPDFNASAIADSDIALLQLNSPASFSQYIRPICLWTLSADFSYIRNSKGYIAGWGADNNGVDVTQEPKMVEARIVNEAECLRDFEIQSLTSTRTLCAGNRDGTGPCIGDSGSGLMVNLQGTWTLRGITSVGATEHRTCKLSHFVVFCDVAKHMSWIRQNMIN